MSSLLPRVQEGEGRKPMYVLVYTCQKYLWKDTEDPALSGCLHVTWDRHGGKNPLHGVTTLSFEFYAQAGKEEGGDCRLWVIWACRHTFLPFLPLHTHRESCGASDLWTVPPEFSISTETQAIASLESLTVVTRDDGH